MSSPPQSRRPFRVIILGGAISGLTLANALARAHIPFLLIERKPDRLVAAGAGLAIWPSTLRLFQQIDAYNAVMREASPVEKFIFRREDGTPIVRRERYKENFVERMGEAYMGIDRTALLKALWDALQKEIGGRPGIGEVRFGVKVVGVEDREDCVRVKFEDGTVEEGDVLVGCDGVRSIVRDWMWKGTNGEKLMKKDGEAIKVPYKLVTGKSDNMPELPSGHFQAIFPDKGTFLMVLPGAEQTWWTLVESQPTTQLADAPRYTTADLDDMMQRHANDPVAEGITFGDVAKRQTWMQCFGTEDGFVGQWYNGRLVLVGDAVHKVTPHFGWGANVAIESAAALANALHELTTKSTNPTISDITAAFKSYQNVRYPRAYAIWKASSEFAKAATGKSYIGRFLTHWLMPRMSDEKMSDRMAEFCRDSVLLEYLPEPQGIQGSIPWKGGKFAGGQGVDVKTMTVGLSVGIVLAVGIAVGMGYVPRETVLGQVKGLMELSWSAGRGILGDVQSSTI